MPLQVLKYQAYNEFIELSTNGQKNVDIVFIQTDFLKISPGCKELC